jgi:integrase
MARFKTAQIARFRIDCKTETALISKWSSDVILHTSSERHPSLTGHGSLTLMCHSRKLSRCSGAIDRVWSRARPAARLRDVRLHDLRHSFASIGVVDGLSLPIIGALLGHKHSATTAKIRTSRYCERCRRLQKLQRQIKVYFLTSPLASNCFR